MKYIDFYNKIKDPISAEENIRRILELYSNDSNFSCTNYYHPEEEAHYDSSQFDELYLGLYNRWKKIMIERSTEEWEELIKEGKVERDIYDFIEILKKLPDIHNGRDVRRLGNSIENEQESKLVKKYKPLSLSWNSGEYIESRYVSGFKDKKIEAEHRLYFNVSGEDQHRFVIAFIGECEKRGLPYYIKLFEEDERDDKIVVYSDTEDLVRYAEMLEEMKLTHPELIKKVGPPPILTGKLLDWVGYGSEPIKSANSYNGKRERIVKAVIDSDFKKWLNENKHKYIDYNGRRVSYGEYAARKLLESSISKAKQDWDYRSKKYFFFNGRDLDNPQKMQKITENLSKSYDKAIYDWTTGQQKSFNVRFKVDEEEDTTSYLGDLKKIYVDSVINNPEHLKNLIGKIRNIATKFGVDQNNFAFDSKNLELLKLAAKKNGEQMSLGQENDTESSKDSPIPIAHDKTATTPLAHDKTATTPQKKLKKVDMKYVDFYAHVADPLQNNEAIDRILDIYATNSDLYYGLINYQPENEKKYNTEKFNKFYAGLFNRWKKMMLERSVEEWEELISLGSVDRDIYEFIRHLKMVPDIEKGNDAKILGYNAPEEEEALFKKYRPLYHSWTAGQFIESQRISGYRESRRIKGEHRLYFNVNDNDMYDFASALIETCEEHELPYYICLFEDDERDGRVILYCDTQDLLQYEEMLEEMPKKYPDLIKRIGPPPILTGKLLDWVGYGSEPIKSVNSYNGKRSDIIKKALDEDLKNWLSDNRYMNIDYNGRRVSYGGYAARKLLERKISEAKQDWDYRSKNYFFFHGSDLDNPRKMQEITLKLSSTYDSAITRWLIGKTKSIKLQFIQNGEERNFDGTSELKKIYVDTIKNNQTRKSNLVERIRTTANMQGVDGDNFAFDYKNIELLIEADRKNSQDNTSSNEPLNVTPKDTNNSHNYSTPMSARTPSSKPIINTTPTSVRSQSSTPNAILNWLNKHFGRENRKKHEQTMITNRDRTQPTVMRRRSSAELATTKMEQPQAKEPSRIQEDNKIMRRRSTAALATTQIEQPQVNETARIQEDNKIMRRRSNAELATTKMEQPQVNETARIQEDNKIMRRRSSAAIATPIVEQTTPLTLSSSFQNEELAEDTTYHMGREELIQDTHNIELASLMTEEQAGASQEKKPSGSPKRK